MFAFAFAIGSIAERQTQFDSRRAGLVSAPNPPRPPPHRRVLDFDPGVDSVAPHVELALILVRCVKPEPFVEPQSGIDLDHPKRDRSAGSRCFFD
jgi:hypothetical protein